MKRVIVWFRQDLRLNDNEMLSVACSECDEVIPVFIDDDQQQSISHTGSASRVWLHHSLQQLMSELQQHNTRLILKQGDSLSCLQQLIEEVQATHVYWNRCYEPAIRQRDAVIKSTLKQTLQVQSFKGNLLFEPWNILKHDGTPYRVFTPYWKAMQQRLMPSLPLSVPSSMKPTAVWPDSLSLNDLHLLPSSPRWDEGMMAYWNVGESAAVRKLAAFLDSSVQDYKTQRDFPAIDATSKLSPHLHFGEISPAQIFYYAKIGSNETPQHDEGIGHLLREVAWREFAYYLLYHFPHSLSEPLNPKFARFAWQNNSTHELALWQQGNTGFPLIDAGMRELWHTGWMHNRVRMIVASFLTKNCLIPWQQGEAWFRDTLVDADLASNTLGWQWVAGCGADAAPYFRIFNPVLQSKKFDAAGEYIRRWVPELRSLDEKHIHQPSAAIAKKLGYATEMLDLKASRERALSRYSDIK